MTREPCHAHGAPFDLPEEHRSQYGHKFPCVGEALSLAKGRGMHKSIHVIEEPRQDRKLLVVDKCRYGWVLRHLHVRRRAAIARAVPARSAALALVHRSLGAQKLPPISRSRLGPATSETIKFR